MGTVKPTITLEGLVERERGMTPGQVWHLTGAEIEQIKELCWPWNPPHGPMYVLGHAVCRMDR
jgi:hypothetical protein